MRSLPLLFGLVLASCDCGPVDPEDDARVQQCDPDEVPCGDACCVTGSRCIGLVCCPVQIVCGTSCCNADHLCIDDECLECPNQLCLGQCCPEAYGCSDTGCCAAEQICQGSCCGAGRICEADQCVIDCGDDERCGPEGDPICCEGEDVCLRDGCVTPGDPCSDDEGCDPSDFCDPDRRRCLPRGDAGPPDAGVDAGAPDAGAPDAAADAAPKGR